MKPPPPLLLWRYGVALLTTVLALGFTALLRPLVGARVYPLFFAAVLVSAGVGGRGPGITAALLSALTVNYFLIEPRFQLHLAQPGEVVAMGLFLLVSTLIIAVTEAQRWAQERAQAAHGQAAGILARYQALVQASSQAVWRLDARGQPLEEQDWWHELTGQSRAASRDWGWLDAVHPEDRERVRAAWLQALESRTPFEAEYRVRSRSGEYQHLAIRGIPLYSPEGAFREWVGTVTDITERQRAEARLRFLAEAGEILASSLDYQATLASVAKLAVPQIADWCSIDVLGEDGAIRNLVVAHVDPDKVEWARALQQRYPADPAAPRGLPQVLRTGRPELYPEIPDALLVEAARDPEHLQLLREVGFASAMIVPLLAHGRTLGALSFISTQPGRRYGPQDLTLAGILARRAALAMENARLYQELQEADQRKDEFLAMLGHELRSPLSAVATTLQLLRRRYPPVPGLDRLLDRVDRQVQRMGRLIDDMQDVTRISRGKILLRLEAVDLVPLVQEAVEDLRSAAEEDQVALTVTLPPAPLRVRGDPMRLSQVLVNLLNNALKFTDAGGSVTVELAAEDRLNTETRRHGEGRGDRGREEQGDGERGSPGTLSPPLSPSGSPCLRVEPVRCAVIRVRDTGIGIEPAALPRLFDSFSQAERSLERSRGGLGLGLALVKGLVELHGGEVSAASAGLGHGAEFIVRLPLLSEEG